MKSGEFTSYICVLCTPYLLMFTNIPRAMTTTVVIPMSAGNKIGITFYTLLLWNWLKSTKSIFVNTIVAVFVLRTTHKNLEWLNFLIRPPSWACPTTLVTSPVTCTEQTAPPKRCRAFRFRNCRTRAFLFNLSTKIRNSSRKWWARN